MDEQKKCCDECSGTAVDHTLEAMVPICEDENCPCHSPKWEDVHDHPQGTACSYLCSLQRISEESPLQPSVQIVLTLDVPPHRVDEVSQALADLVFSLGISGGKLEQGAVGIPPLTKE